MRAQFKTEGWESFTVSFCVTMDVLVKGKEEKLEAPTISLKVEMYRVRYSSLHMTSCTRSGTAVEG